MTLQEIKSKDDTATRVEFLKKIVSEHAKCPELFEDNYTDWEFSIMHTCENFNDAGREGCYNISYCNTQILDPHETKNGQAFRISVWRAELWTYDNEGEKVELMNDYTAFDWEE